MHFGWQNVYPLRDELCGRCIAWETDLGRITTWERDEFGEIFFLQILLFQASLAMTISDSKLKLTFYIVKRGFRTPVEDFRILFVSFYSSHFGLLVGKQQEAREDERKIKTNGRGIVCFDGLQN